MEKANLKPTKEIFALVRGSNEYLRTFENDKRKQLIEKQMGRVAVSGGEHPLFSAARTIADETEKKKNGYLNIEELQVRVMGLMPAFLAGQNLLDNNREKYTRQQKKNILKDKIIPFNHALREMVDNGSDLTINEILRFSAETAVISYRSSPNESVALADYVSYAQECTRDALEGMRHEIAATEALWSNPEVANIRNADADQELDGIDLIVELKDGQVFELDVKASAQSASNKNQNRYHGEPYAVWSGFKASDFGAKQYMKPSKEAIDSKKAYYGRIVSNLKNSNGIISQNVV